MPGMALVRKQAFGRLVCLLRIRFCANRSAIESAAAAIEPSASTPIYQSSQAGRSDQAFVISPLFPAQEFPMPRIAIIVITGLLALLHAYIGWRVLPDLPDRKSVV